MRLLRREVSVLFAAAAIVLPCAADEAAIFGFVQKNCVGCHSSTVTSGDVNLAALHGSKTFDADREIWERVASKLKTGQMPPPGIPRPAETDIAAVTGFLDAEFARLDRGIKPEAGRVTARRLNRAEYSNTLRDLLGIH